eukprot:TRINITY_DN7293_c0_g1_i1.p1 TRINITY_DN7293_c0_g1~~TRINITY_DN7293_c0_g1_i1.p1  ORF type:complete len:194 (-),score=32.34 TRINITY_DN7293_c0_g1_i1:29-610(-)
MGCASSHSSPTGNNQTTPTSTEYSHLFKIVLVGKMNVGKSSVILRYIEDIFTAEEVATLGEEYSYKLVPVSPKGNQIKFQIWDTAGQEKFRNITVSYYRQASAVLVVFALDDRSSFEEVRHWIQDAENFAEQPLLYYILGNKSDLPSVIEKSEIEELAEEMDAIYFEVSAANGKGVNECFNSVAQDLFNTKSG